MKKPGTINGAIIATLQDCKGTVLGYTIDTPNAIAYAMAINSKVSRAVSNYALFGKSITTRGDVSDRFGWVVKEKEIHAKYLTWL